ncbi:MAG: DoxX family protein [Planctomycetes bacterium]|nr:DoxX family protein [Planctomycetota bacterium]
MASLFVPRPLPAGASFGLLLARVSTGVALGLHGIPKLENLTTWDQGGTGFPAAVVALGAIAEGVFGWCLAAGFLTPLASLMCTGVMAVAVWFHVSKGDVFVSADGKAAAWEIAGIYCAVSFMTLLAGPGGLSVDKLLFGRKRGDSR